MCEPRGQETVQEILDDDYQPISTHESIAAKTSTSDACSQTMSKKCCPVFLGGSSVPRGIGTSLSQSVIMFEDQEWDSSCDNLFFR
ncbi:protein C8orf37-like isoform X2 [Sinocyclocheilus grahami]|uniref:protein C8orf37-like isoform X2 n=1 Tax=Sinocyclocheilus grahami TaxID=75366 RepID=UPI0007AD126C|nr:PREDICTED: protein C8orf37-like isoform X2 [Sinocyclocheilus grahami]